MFVPKKLNELQIQEFLQKKALGTSVSTLAKEYGISRTLAYNYINLHTETLQNIEAIKKQTLDKALEDAFNELSNEAREILVAAFRELKKKIPQASVRDLVGVISTFGNMRIIKDDSTDADEPISVNITFAKTGEKDAE